MPADVAPLIIEFAPGTSIHRERDLVSRLPILGNGPPGTFVDLPGGLRVSLPTDQIVFAHVVDGRLKFVREREILPEDQLSPARSHTMWLEPAWVSSILVDGRVTWSREAPAR